MFNRIGVRFGERKVSVKYKKLVPNRDRESLTYSKVGRIVQRFAGEVVTRCKEARSAGYYVLQLSPVVMGRHSYTMYWRGDGYYLSFFSQRGR